MVHSNKAVLHLSYFLPFFQVSVGSFMNLDTHFGKRFNKAARTAKPSLSESPLRWSCPGSSSISIWTGFERTFMPFHMFTFKYSAKISIGGGWSPNLTAVTGKGGPTCLNTSTLESTAWMSDVTHLWWCQCGRGKTLCPSPSPSPTSRAQNVNYYVLLLRASLSRTFF